MVQRQRRGRVDAEIGAAADHDGLIRQKGADRHQHQRAPAALAEMGEKRRFLLERTVVRLVPQGRTACPEGALKDRIGRGDRRSAVAMQVAPIQPQQKRIDRTTRQRHTRHKKAVGPESPERRLERIQYLRTAHHIAKAFALRDQVTLTCHYLIPARTAASDRPTQ